MPYDGRPQSTAALQTQQPRVYSYARWSTDEQAKGDTLRRQLEAAERWALRKGLQLDERLSYRDEGISAYRGRNAAVGGLGIFVEYCERALIEPGSYLLVESFDRLSRRDPWATLDLLRPIINAGITIVTLSDGQEFDRESMRGMSLILAIMVSMRAHEESATKSRRVAAAWAEKRRKVRAGESPRLTSRAPAWLVAGPDGTWLLDECRVAIVQRIYAMTLTGIGEHAIAARFNSESVPVLGRGRSAGKHWHRSTVSKVLRNAAVIGTLVPGRIDYAENVRRHVREEPIPGAFPSIIDDTDWLAVRALKDGSAGATRGSHAASAVTHFCAGLARCPECGSTMTRVYKGAKGKSGQPKLVCTAAKTKAGCRYVSVPVSTVQDAFSSGWGNLFANVPADDPSGLLDQRYNGLEAAIDGRLDHLSDLAKMLEQSPSASLARAVARAEAEIATLRHQLEEADEARRLADRGLIGSRMGQLHELLNPEPTEENPEPTPDWTEINARLKVLFRGVVIDYRTGSLRFQWRQGGETSIVYAWVDCHP